MLALVQRVTEASVEVDGISVGSIGRGLCVLLCAVEGDSDDDAIWMAGKLARLRIFPNESGHFDQSVQDVGGSLLLVSQFTLVGDCRKGNRPSFTHAARPEVAEPLLLTVAHALQNEHHVPVETGQFQAAMQVHLVNDGPVTVMVASPHSQ